MAKSCASGYGTSLYVPRRLVPHPRRLDERAHVRVRNHQTVLLGSDQVVWALNDGARAPLLGRLPLVVSRSSMRVYVCEVAERRLKVGIKHLVRHSL